MIELVIRLNPQTGAVTVTGPIQDRILMKGMCEEAKRVIDQWHSEQKGKTRIVPANGPLPSLHQ